MDKKSYSVGYWKVSDKTYNKIFQTVNNYFIKFNFEMKTMNDKQRKSH